MKKIKVYTDGACSNNPGPGGWGVVFTGTKKLKVLSGYDINTTNNKMELKAVVEALKCIMNNCKKFEGTIVEIYSDSAYVVNAINNKWVGLWATNDWRTAKGSPVKNKSLWTEYMYVTDELLYLGISFKLVKVKGHNGDTYNEYVDGVARSEVNNARLYIATNGEIGGDI